MQLLQLGEPGLQVPVSILYEANELCNGGPRGDWGRQTPVSILYEANELCNGCGRGRG